MTLEVGAQAPPFALRNQRREKVSLDDLAGARAVLVFIPFAFTRVCEGELCQLRDNLGMFEANETRVVAITCDTTATNAKWADENDVEFDILSDFWPHGEVSRLYDTFNEGSGYANRTTYFVDEHGVITEVIASSELGTPRPFVSYLEALRTS